MGFGVEAYLGFRKEHFDDLAKLFDTQIFANDNFEFNPKKETIDLINKTVEEARHFALAPLGITPTGRYSKLGNRDLDQYYKTPRGEYEFNDLSFITHFAPGAMDEESEHCVIGIRIFGWYGPYLLDWDKNVNDYMLIIDQETIGIVERFKKYLTDKWSIFAKSEFIIKPANY